MTQNTAVKGSTLTLPQANYAFGHGLSGYNVNHLLPLALQAVQQLGRPVTSRGLATLEMPGPTMSVYHRPAQCVLIDPVRDANPFFHFFEAMWILAGSDDAAMPSFFLQSVLNYSDDGHRFHGAYGHRLRNWMPTSPTRRVIDQLDEVVKMLREKPDTRQAVCSIWNPERDLGATTKDIPCNDMLMFKVRDGALNMTVCNRSNDIIWGAYGANAVQFSIILQYVAARAGLPVGRYTQFSDSLHVYTELPLWQKYVAGEWQPHGHIQDPYQVREDWRGLGTLFRDDEDAESFGCDAKAIDQMARMGHMGKVVMWPATNFASMVGRYVARPMLLAYMDYKAGDFKRAAEAAGRIERPDWRDACLEWLDRRAAKRAGDAA